MKNINEKLRELSFEQYCSFNKRFIDVLGDPKAFPWIYEDRKIDKINPDIQKVKEIVYEEMFKISANSQESLSQQYAFSQE